MTDSNSNSTFTFTFSWVSYLDNVISGNMSEDAFLEHMDWASQQDPESM